MTAPCADRGADDWAAVVERMQRGDKAAFLKLHRLVSVFLAGRRAFDFRDEWPDLIQEVLLKLSRAVRNGELRSGRAILSYIRTITHNQFIDRLRVHIRHGEGKQLPWDEVMREAESQQNPEASWGEMALDVRRALEKLPKNNRDLVIGVYGAGKTYKEISEETGIPLGTVKRHLRESVAALREVLRDENDNDAGPI